MTFQLIKKIENDIQSIHFLRTVIQLRPRSGKLKMTEYEFNPNCPSRERCLSNDHNRQITLEVSLGNCPCILPKKNRIDSVLDKFTFCVTLSKHAPHAPKNARKDYLRIYDLPNFDLFKDSGRVQQRSGELVHTLSPSFSSKFQTAQDQQYDGSH